MKFTGKEKWFIFFSMLSVFIVCGEYAMTRPASNTLFLTLFSSKGYPWAWLATVPLNLAIVYLYSRFLPQWGPFKVLSFFALFVIAVNTLASLLYGTLPHFIFFQYIWKDIYILFMLKQVWSLIHGTIPAARAKYLYGFIYGFGTCGAVLGSLIPGYLATVFGSEQILLLTLPAYLLLLLFYKNAYDRSNVTAQTFLKELTPDPRPKEAFSLIRRSSLLLAALLLVIFMQVSVGLMEYRFNAGLELEILEKDLRTAYYGKLSGMVNLLCLGLQFFGSIFMVRLFGVRGSHFFIPALLCLSALSSLLIPTFAILSFSYVFLKAIDFSLFGVIREMLYIPVGLDAKFRAKAIIDVFAYRTSKAFVSFGLLLLQLLIGGYTNQIVGYVSLAIFLAWMGTVVLLFRKKDHFASI